MKILTTDNNGGNFRVESGQCLKDLQQIADCPLNKLKDKDNNDVWLFPNKGERHDDRIEKEVIISLCGDRLTTGNIMGFIGYGDTQLTIRSRFSNKGEGHDWFMQYMLQKVFAINIFDLKHSGSDDGALDIAALLFPYFLHKALCQGVYKEYIRCEYNDSHPKGTLSIQPHIKNNFPFKNGRISYTTREYKYDNSVTQLVRHTIEYLKSKDYTRRILSSDQDTAGYVKQIIEATPTYCKGDRQKVMLANAKPKIHPYYSEYRPLQKLCLQILKQQRMGYGQTKKRIYGVLFDGAWLWEEYLNITMSKAGFKHPKNKTGEDCIYPFRGRNKYKRFPDFMMSGIIADAKYKNLLAKPDSSERAPDIIQRDDLNQMISYLHITSSKIGIFIGPTEVVLMDSDTGRYYPDDTVALSTREIQILKVGDLMGDGGQIIILGVNIPQEATSYQEFEAVMSRTEGVLLNHLRRISMSSKGTLFCSEIFSRM